MPLCHVRILEWIYSTLYNCLNFKELLARDIWSSGDSNRNRTHNHLVRERRVWVFFFFFTNQVVVGSIHVVVTEASIFKS